MKSKSTTFFWSLGNGLIAIAITYMLDMNYAYAPLLVPVLNLFTKEVNKTFNPNYSKKHGKR